MKRITLLSAVAALLAASPVLAHGNTKPQHGGVVQMSGETLFELVRSRTGVAIYVSNDDGPMASATTTGKLSITAAGQTRAVALKPGPGNRLDAPGLKLAPGAKLAVQVIDKTTQARVGTTFIIK